MQIDSRAWETSSGALVAHFIDQGFSASAAQEIVRQAMGRAQATIANRKAAAVTRSTPYQAWLAQASPEFVWDRVFHEIIAGYVDRIVAGDLRQLAIFLPPRIGKSEMVTIRLPVYWLESNPRSRVIVGAYNKDLATFFASESLRIYRRRNPQMLASEAEDAWETKEGGGVLAVGVGSGVTGRGADLMIVDDPTKNYEEAISPAYQQRVWNWWLNDMRTRRNQLQRTPTILIQCVAGHTRILCADGSWAQVTDLRAGDRVASYDMGTGLVGRAVLGVRRSGHDSLLRIATNRCAATVNAEHPFLVVPGYRGDGNGVPLHYEWRPAGELQVGDVVVTAKEIEPEAPLDLERVPWRGVRLERIWAIEDAGHGDVYDLAVEGENFVAEGFVVHNTRWTDLDLAGRILEQDREKKSWTVLSLPALAAADDPLGRAEGESIWPERMPVDELQEMREEMGPRFDALYGQDPAPAEGTLIRSEWFWYDYVDESQVVSRCRMWDIAASVVSRVNSQPDYTAGVRMALLRLPDGKYRYAVEDAARIRALTGDRDDFIVDVAKADGLDVPQVFEEGDDGDKTVTHYIRQRLPTHVVLGVKPRRDKIVRSSNARSALQKGDIFLTRGRWNHDFVHELIRFPAGRHDDQVDAFAEAYNQLVMRALLVQVR